MTPSYSQTRKNFPLSKWIIFKRLVQGTILLIFLILILYFSGIFALDLNFNLTSQIVGSLILVIILIGYFYQRANFSSFYYDVTDDYLLIKSDPIFPREVTIPYDRILSVTIDRDIFDMLLGLWDLHINTTTSVFLGMEAHIDGLTRETANGLQGLIMAKMKDNGVKSK